METSARPRALSESDDDARGDALAVAPRSARERMQRTTYFATGVATALFVILLANGPNGFLAQMDQLRAPFGAFSVLVGAAMPASYAILAWFAPMRVLRTLVTAGALGFVLAQLLWVPMMTGDALADGAAPWLQGYGAIHATLLAVAWNRPPVWLFAVAQGPLVAIVEYLASGGDLEQSLLDGIGALVTSLILTGAGAGVVTAAARQDQEAERARAEAAREAAERTGEREQARINAVVHDEIISVLLAAVRQPVNETVPERAQRALGYVAAIRGARTGDAAYPPTQVVAALRATASAISDDIIVQATVTATEEVPAPAVTALAEAAGEAMRNSVIHAGEPGERVSRVLTVTVADGDVRVTVRDDGRGFVPKSVSARRLGLQVSIRGRMEALAGGGSRISSKPGRGTTVELWWRAEDAR
ncbi:sensor histidine kinase [Demequina phytophila]|uniref:sensor histidine kinase n=1 Tax=Demequina phytophila TaxID=1638981 RepID=UPI000783E3A7|nr:ATP-binding protein [Demequina phytophila]